MAGSMPAVPASALPPSRGGGPPPPPPPPPHAATPSPPLPSPRNIRKEVQKEIKNLDSSDKKVLMKATAALLMLSTLPEAENYLPSAVPRLVMLLDESQPSHLASLLQCLGGTTREIDEGLQINSAAALSVLLQREEGLKLVHGSDASDVLLSVLCSSQNARVQEEVVDTFCALAAHEDARPALIEKAVVSKLANNLGSASAEICVRTLLVLGMLCGSSPNAQFELVQAEGSIVHLLKLTKSNDHDIQGISGDLLGALYLNKQIRPLIDEALKSTSDPS